MTARRSSSALLVPTTPTDPAHASSKSYVDAQIAGVVSGSGAIPANIIDAKGDLLVGSADNTVVRKGVGANGYWLKSDSSQALDGLVWALVTKADVGLGNVDNTADTAKPVSTAQQSALDLKAPLASPAFTGTPTGITKTHVGLGNVDNTADSAKPVSTAQQTALDLKANLASPTFTGTVAGITKAMVGLGSADNTADTAKPVSTAQQTALNLKADLASPTFTGTVSGITKAMVGLGNVDNTSDATERAAVATLTNKTLTSPVINTPTGIVKGDVGLGNVDNTSDVTKNAAAVTLTNKTIDGANNTLTVRQADVTGLVAALGAKEPTISAGTTVQYWRGDKSWQTLVTPAVPEVVLVSSAASLTLTAANSIYVYTGAGAATWTLPPVAGNPIMRLVLDNRGTGTVTVQRAGTDQIWHRSAVTSVILGPGSAREMVNDGTYWNSISTSALTDAEFYLQDDVDATKQTQFQCSGIATGTTRTLTIPDANTTIVGTDATQILTNKTLGSTNTLTGLVPADFILVQTGNTARATGSGDFAVGHYVGRAFTVTKVVYQFDTVDASGNTTVELRRNGAQVTSSNLTVSAANQVDGTATDAARTATISQSFAVGDRINLQITAVGTTPGKGLRAWILGTWN